MTGSAFARRTAMPRLGLGYLAVTEIVVGLWQLLLPRSFYDDFPLPGHPWVAMLPSYNEHLLRDLGGLNTGMGVMLMIAAVTLDRLLTRTVLLGYLLYSATHLAFHLGHLSHFTVFDSVGQVVTLTLGAVLPILLLCASGRGRPQPPSRRPRPAGAAAGPGAGVAGSA